jgi:hypothetical protein
MHCRTLGCINQHVKKSGLVIDGPRCDIDSPTNDCVQHYCQAEGFTNQTSSECPDVANHRRPGTTPSVTNGNPGPLYRQDSEPCHWVRAGQVLRIRPRDPNYRMRSRSPDTKRKELGGTGCATTLHPGRYTTYLDVWLSFVVVGSKKIKKS